MQENEKKYLENLKASRSSKRRMKLLMLVCGLLVTGGVMGALILPGVGQNGDPTCGKTEHTHTEDCTVVGYSCGQEEDHVHTEECKAVYSCGLEEHTHTDECYDSSQESSEAQEDGYINERLVISLTSTQSTGLTGETLQAQVRSNYSGANLVEGNIAVKIQIGKLPEGVTIAGFNSNGELVVKYEDANGSEQQITLYLRHTEGSSEDEGWYVEYDQPQGATLNFNISFNSENGIMPSASSLTLHVSDDDVSGLPELEEGQKDVYPTEDLELSWTSTHGWDAVDKKVNNANHNKIAVTEDNVLSGILTYTIQANSQNNDTYGDIWTDYMLVEDTLTLPTNISLPDDVKISEDKSQIVTADGQTILSFAEPVEGTTIVFVDLSISGKKITYELKVVNANRKADGTLTKEMPHLSLVMELNAELLVLPENYCVNYIDEISKDIIQNDVKIESYPCQDYEKSTSKDAVTTTPELEEAEISLTKTADKESVEAGEIITYHIELENTGSSPIAVKDSNGELYTVTDVLPKYLYLTETQIEALPESASYNADTNTVSWIPSEIRILAGEKYSLDIETTVKDIETLNTLKLENGAFITNKVSYKDKESEPVDITYKKAQLEITKTSEDETGDGIVYNGETLTYTVTVTNTGDVDAKVSEKVEDILPSAFEFESMTIGASMTVKDDAAEETEDASSEETENDADDGTENDVVDGTEDDADGGTEAGTTSTTEGETTTLTESGTGILHTDAELCEKEHAFSFTTETVEVKSVKRQMLAWDIGCLAAGETVTITYVGTVNTDLLGANEDGTVLTNTAEITDGKATNEIGVDYPVAIDKEVTNILVNGQEVPVDVSAAYPTGTVFTYSITVTNDAEHPSTDRYLAITDYLPVGMMPVAEEDGDMVLLRTDKTTKETDTIEWADFESSWDRENYSFSTTLDGYPVTVQLSENGQIKLYIDGIKKMDPGQTITIVYKTQMNLTEEQIEAGKSYQFTNTAKIGNASDSVTVTGGVKVGSLKITKQFLNYMNQSSYVKATVDSGFSDTDPQMDVTYVLTGKDENGNQIVFEDGTTEITFQLRDFYLHSNGKAYVYEINKLPIGTYTLVESNYQLDGYNVWPEMSVEYNGVTNWYGNTATITIGENKQTTIWNNNCCYPKLRVKLQKSVYEIARETTNEDGTTTWTTLSEKYLFATDDDPNTKTMVVYNVTLTATGYGKFEVGDVVDTLPDGMKYIGICTYPNYEKSRSSFRNSPGANVVKTLPGSSYGELNNCMSVAVKPEVLNKYKGVYIKDTYDEATNQVKFRFAINTESGIHYLNAGEVLTFLVLCEVDDSSVVAGQPLENTVEFDVKDTVMLSENPTFKTVNTPYDANQNNGDTIMTENGDGTNTVSSSVTIMP